MPSFGLLRHCTHMVHRHICRRNTHTHKIKINLKKKQQQQQSLGDFLDAKLTTDSRKKATRLEWFYKPFSPLQTSSINDKTCAVDSKTQVFTLVLASMGWFFFYAFQDLFFTFRFCRWEHSLWQKSYAAHVWLLKRPRSSISIRDVN